MAEFNKDELIKQYYKYLPKIAKIISRSHEYEHSSYYENLIVIKSIINTLTKHMKNGDDVHKILDDLFNDSISSLYLISFDYKISVDSVISCFEPIMTKQLMWPIFPDMLDTIINNRQRLYYACRDFLQCRYLVPDILIEITKNIIIYYSYRYSLLYPFSFNIIHSNSIAQQKSNKFS